MARMVGPQPHFHAPTFVLTHRPRPPLEMDRGTTFHFLVAAPPEALDAQARCRKAGVLVGCFRPPSTPDGSSRLRITASARLSDADLARALDAVGRVLA